MTVATLRLTMTENELRDWQKYAARFMLPTRRLQVQLAHIGMLIAICMGGAKNAKLADFLFDPPPTDKERKQVLQDAIRFFGFKPVAKRVRKRGTK